jgi:hypothetical protein
VSEVVLRVSGLYKKFGKTEALKCVSLELHKGGGPEILQAGLLCGVRMGSWDLFSGLARRQRALPGQWLFVYAGISGFLSSRGAPHWFRR